jgi:heparin binding hemagglutinin HbhA
MTEPKTTNIPAPLYAAAGAGDLAYRQLRKLPTLYADLSGKAANNGVELRERAVATSTELRERAVEALREANRQANEAAAKLRANDFDVERLREAAIRNAAAFVAGAQAAQERAVAVYGELVARGEKVVGTGIVEAADTVNADIEATEKPAVTATPADVAAVKPAVKKTTAKKTTAKKATPAQ